VYEAKVGDNNIQKFMAASFNGHACLNFAHRYFSGCTNSTVMPIPKEIDPTGRLATMGQGLHFNDDNQVAYLHRENPVGEGRQYVSIQKERRIRDTDKNMHSVSGYSPVDPGAFAVGQIVEVQFTLCAKVVNSKWKVFHDLLAVILLDKTINKVREYPHVAFAVANILYQVDVAAKNTVSDQTGECSSKAGYAVQTRLVLGFVQRTRTRVWWLQERE
jgi:hypothetical protein